MSIIFSNIKSEKYIEKKNMHIIESLKIGGNTLRENLSCPRKGLSLMVFLVAAQCANKLWYMNVNSTIDWQ